MIDREPPMPVPPQARIPKKLKPGDIGFFKRVKDTSSDHGRYTEFKGHGFGILLGAVPPGAQDPPQSFLTALMAQLGWVTLDEVKNLLGEASVDALVRALEKKYFHAEAPKETTPPEPEKPASSIILLPQGK